MNLGEYLVAQNIIQGRGLGRAQEIQKTDRVPLGQLAMQEGLIDNKQLFRILSRQRKLGHKHKNFEKLAVAMETGLAVYPSLFPSTRIPPFRDPWELFSPISSGTGVPAVDLG